MKLKLFLLGFFLILSLTSNAQIIIKGIIIENIYKSPINKVEINYENKSIFSNIDGKFEIKIKSLPTKLIFKDFRYYTREIELKSGSQNLIIQLTNKGFLLDQIIIKSDINEQKLKTVSMSTSTMKNLNLKKLEGEYKKLSYMVLII